MRVCPQKPGAPSSYLSFLYFSVSYAYFWIRFAAHETYYDIFMLQAPRTRFLWIVCSSDRKELNRFS